ncbi:MAG: TonB-dependent receptor [Gemmatimonadota bacterium]|jgi:TonB-linked SusC/RagA family outer membrane protein
MRHFRSALAGALALVALAFLAAPPGAAAQDYTIVGRVLDAVTGAPISGAQISIEGTSLGAISDQTGRYSIPAALSSGTYTLRVTYIGREAATNQVTLGAEGIVRAPDFLLRESALELGEIVVTGTAGPTSRRALGNSVSTVAAEDVSKSVATTIDQTLQGRVAGATIISNTGTPGGGVSMRLRGTSSITGGAEPLFIVDGVIIDNNGDQQINVGYRSNPSNRLADLDPDDIERVEILKGAAAAALYGSRANNGVVQIFTKRGQAGATRIVVSTKIQRSELTESLPWALTPVDTDGNPVTRYNHEDLLFRDAWSNDSYVAVSGGSGDTRYYLSANWLDQEGIEIGSGHEKLNLRLNLDQGFSDWLELSAGANLVRSHTDLQINGENGTGGLLTAIVFTPTTVDLAERDPETGEYVNDAFVFANPLSVVDDWSTPQDIRRFVGSFQARANPTEGLTAEYRLGYDNVDMETALFIPRGATGSPTGTASSVNRTSSLINNDIVANYQWAVGDALDLTTSAGMNSTVEKVQNLNLGASDLAPATELVRGAVQSASEGEVETTTLGFFAQQQIGYRDRLFVAGGLRWDASSTFGEDERWQLYPKVSGSWVISDESFFEGLPDAVTQLRLRAALGYAGNQPTLGQAYARFARYGTTNNVGRLGLVPLGQAGNPNLKPERQREWEAGFDLSLFEERIGLNFTYYDQFIEDLLLDRPFSPSTGFSNILQNVGEMSNWGTEIELRTVNIDRPDFGWSSQVIYSRNNNIVDSLAVDPFGAGYNNWVQQGYPIGVFRMPAYERDGNGNIVTDDVGPVLAADRQIVGNPWPDYALSLNNDFRFGRQLTLSVLLDGQFGHEVWNQTQRIMDIFSAGPLYDQLLRGEITSEYRSRVQGIWEAYLEDASFVKLRNLTLRYDLGSENDFVRRLGAEGLQVELQGRNLYTWTDYSGYDPEVNMFGLSTVARGVDFATYPNARTVSLGLRAIF